MERTGTNETGLVIAWLKMLYILYNLHIMRISAWQIKVKKEQETILYLLT